jgi:hypothetical protein
MRFLHIERLTVFVNMDKQCTHQIPAQDASDRYVRNSRHRQPYYNGLGRLGISAKRYGTKGQMDHTHRSQFFEPGKVDYHPRSNGRS